MTARRGIRPLPPRVVDRIAAGEVVERPASVVKELVENSLDAGAATVTVEIEEGGRALIRIIDDGGGIDAADLPLAFQQHATSKIADDAELEAVATMGFRGEALASIGSVARCRLTSRVGDEPAFTIDCDGGDVSPVRPAAGNMGTSVEVRELFFNVPARRKFLKAAAAEAGQVTDIVTRLALARPDVTFRYVRDGKSIAEFPASDDLFDRLPLGWPGEYRERLVRLDARDGDHRLHGVLGLPEYAATTGRYFHLYVNGRAVKDRSLQHAVREAYRGLTEPGRTPAAVVLLDVPPDRVDVNVHPAKTEVRFREAGRIWGLVNAACREALLGHDLVPKARPTADPPTVDTPREDVRSALADFFKTSLDQNQQRIEDVSPPAADQAASLRRAFGGTDEDEPAPPPINANVRALQLHNSYLVVESDDGLEIIDQHALHERVLFEELLARVRRGPLEAQRLLMPAVADVPEEHVASLEALAPLLARLGIEADAFGPAAVAVHAFPSLLLDRGRVTDPAAFVAEVLEKAANSPASPEDESLVHETLDLMACKAAVKAGDTLRPAEIDALVARRHLTARASNCPHGRPTTLRLSLGDLEKQFKRTGF